MKLFIALSIIIAVALSASTRSNAPTPQVAGCRIQNQYCVTGTHWVCDACVPIR